jgi:hypothetical protein
MTEQAATNIDALNEYSDQKRLEIYKMLSSACTHLYSKGKLQEDKFLKVAEIFANVTVNDPVFMAHLTAYAAKKDSKDLKVLSVFFNSLNDANGTPFFKGAKQCKPNYREVSYAVLQQLDPHLALRVLGLAHKKFGVDGILNESRHFPTGLKTAFKKYIGFREQNPESLRGMKKSGLANKMQQMYRLTRTHPTQEAASILRWKQKFGGPDTLENLPDFNSMTSDKIAEKLEELRLSPTVALSVIPTDKITAKVAKALLEGCTGNQSIILYNWFARNGFLDVKSIKSLFKDKIASAETAVDRIDTLTKDADEEDKKEMAKVRSNVRKRAAKTADLGKIFLHIDSSSSMQRSIQYAMDNASTVAECVDEPSKNFGWGLFSNRGKTLPLPAKFTKEDFYKILYGVRACGYTDCIALYGEARRQGAEVDVYITDQGHNVGTITKRIADFHEENPDLSKPKAAVIIDFSGNRDAQYTKPLEDGLKRSGIPVSIMPPEALKESALIPQAVATAIKGEMAVLDEILDTPLPTLPKWWGIIKK